jgi:6-phosphogluconolactonase
MLKSIHIFKTESELLKAVADYFVKIAGQSIASDDRFNVALSGGNSPKKLYTLFASDDYKNKVDWKKVYFFFGDERYVPENDPLRNSFMAQQSLFDPLKIAPSQIFKVNATLSPENAAITYYESIQEHFNKKPIRFDLVLLGLGDNAHTASLFPFTSVLAETEATIKSAFVQEQDMFRITMSAPLINQAKQIAFLVYGKEKAAAVNAVLNQTIDTEKYPAQLIKPFDGELHWFLDKSAASISQNENN